MLLAIEGALFNVFWNAFKLRSVSLGQTIVSEKVITKSISHQLTTKIIGLNQNWIVINDCHMNNEFSNLHNVLPNISSSLSFKDVNGIGRIFQVEIDIILLHNVSVFRACSRLDMKPTEHCDTHTHYCCQSKLNVNSVHIINLRSCPPLP